MSTTATFVDYYDILNVPETASEDEIRKALSEQRRLWVKRQNSPDLTKRQLAEQRVKDLTEAERVLFNQERRATFNQQRKTARPESTPTVSDPNADWMARAREYLHAGQMASANFAAREALSTNGGSHEAWSIRAQSAFNLNDWREAEFSFHEAIRIKPDESEYYFDLGSAYEAAGSHSDALKNYEAALKIDAGNPMYKTAVAGIYLQNDQTSRARAIMEEVVKDFPDVDAFQYYLAWAIVDGYEDYATILQNGSFVITSPEQIERLRSEMNRANSLKFEDAQMRTWIQRRLDAAAEAEKDTWRRPPAFSITGRIWLGVFIVSALLIFANGIGVIFVAAAAFFYFKLYKMPAWRANAKDAKGSNLVKKWGVGGQP